MTPERFPEVAPELIDALVEAFRPAQAPIPGRTTEAEMWFREGVNAVIAFLFVQRNASMGLDPDGRPIKASDLRSVRDLFLNLDPKTRR